MILVLLRYLQAVGGWHGDAIQDHYHRTGYSGFYTTAGGQANDVATNPEAQWGSSIAKYYTSYLNNNDKGFRVSSETHTRTYALLGCIYIRRT